MKMSLQTIVIKCTANHRWLFPKLCMTFNSKNIRACSINYSILWHNVYKSPFFLFFIYAPQTHESLTGWLYSHYKYWMRSKSWVHCISSNILCNCAFPVFVGYWNLYELIGLSIRTTKILLIYQVGPIHLGLNLTPQIEMVKTKFYHRLCVFNSNPT